METTDEESSFTGHLEITADSRKGPLHYRFHPMTVCEPRSRSALPLLSLDLGCDTVPDNDNSLCSTVCPTTLMLASLKTMIL